MAERIDALGPVRGRPQLYPWDEWMDGSAWRIRRGDDFLVSATSMAAQLRIRGNRLGVDVSARVVDEDTVEFQFLVEPPERAAAA
jgi:hypothetical protein